MAVAGMPTPLRVVTEQTCPYYHTEHHQMTIKRSPLCFTALGAGLLFSGCFGIQAREPVRRRPDFTISIKPEKEDSELTIAATIENSSAVSPLDLRDARITYLSASLTEVPPLRIERGCVGTVLMPGKRCRLVAHYEIVERRAFPAKWEFSLDGEVVQFTLDN